MAESEKGFDAVKEARRIVSRYFIDLGLARQNKSWIVERVIPNRDWESQTHDVIPDLRHAEDIELEADEKFGQEVDSWRNQATPEAKAVLEEIIKLLDHKPGISFFGKRMLARLKDEVYRE